jgi:Na+/proline symporter
MVAGAIGTAVVPIAVVLVLRHTRRAPYAAMIAGFATAALFIYAHVLPVDAHVVPGFWTLSDSFVSEPHTHVNWFSWLTAALEIATGIAFGVAGARALHAAE